MHLDNICIIYCPSFCTGFYKYDVNKYYKCYNEMDKMHITMKMFRHPEY